MPFGQHTVDLTTRSSPTIELIPVERGILELATLTTTELSVLPLLMWVKIVIASSSDPPENPHGVLAQGFLTRVAPVAWTGSVSLEPDMHIGFIADWNGGIDLVLKWKTR